MDVCALALLGVVVLAVVVGVAVLRAVVQPEFQVCPFWLHGQGAQASVNKQRFLSPAANSLSFRIACIVLGAKALKPEKPEYKDQGPRWQ